MDLPAALAYSTVARATVIPAEHRIWRDLDLSRTSCDEEYPLIQPHSLDQREDGTPSAEQTALQAELRDRSRGRQHINAILMVGDRRRWGLVESVRAVQRPGTHVALVQLLQMVSRNLTSLEISSPPQNQVRPIPQSYDHEALDFKWMDADLIFPQLTHLTIGRGAFQFDIALALLTCNAPNLEALNLYFTASESNMWCEDDVPFAVRGKSGKNDRLRRLRISYENLLNIAWKWTEPMPVEMLNSSSLELLVIQHVTRQLFDDIGNNLLASIDERAPLTDLAWVDSSSHINAYLQEQPAPHVRRLLMIDDRRRVLLVSIAP